jgi:hypothetical protein
VTPTSDPNTQWLTESKRNSLFNHIPMTAGCPSFCVTCPLGHRLREGPRPGTSWSYDREKRGLLELCDGFHTWVQEGWCQVCATGLTSASGVVSEASRLCMCMSMLAESSAITPPPASAEHTGLQDTGKLPYGTRLSWPVSVVWKLSTLLYFLKPSHSAESIDVTNGSKNVIFWTGALPLGSSHQSGFNVTSSEKASWPFHRQVLRSLSGKLPCNCPQPRHMVNTHLFWLDWLFPEKCIVSAPVIVTPPGPRMRLNTSKIAHNYPLNTRIDKHISLFFTGCNLPLYYFFLNPKAGTSNVCP